MMDENPSASQRTNAEVDWCITNDYSTMTVRLEFATIQNSIHAAVK